jgi:hypothetical protein
MLYMSLALLLFGSSLLVPDLFFDAGSASPPQYETVASSPGPSSSASLMDPGAGDASGSSAVGDDAPQRLDVRGNEIARPVARYRLDDRGSLYEVHSPETELPRLKPPVM